MGNLRLLTMTLVISGTLIACQSAGVRGEPVVEASPVPVMSSFPRLDTERSFVSMGPISAELHPARAADGSLVRVQFRTAVTHLDRLEVVFEGKPFPLIPVSERSWDALVVIPYNHRPAKSSVEIRWRSAEGALASVAVPVEVVDGSYAREQIQVRPDHAAPGKEALVRIRKDQKEVGTVYRRMTPQKAWSGPFQLPVESPFTSPFGTKRIFNGKMQSFHQGVDLKAAEGAPVKAAAAGEVALAKDLFFTGNTVIVDHGFGLFTLYAHLSRVDVQQGQQVGAGQLLGLAGMTGRASGPHLHWGAVLRGSKFNPVDLTRVLQ